MFDVAKHVCPNTAKHIVRIVKTNNMGRWFIYDIENETHIYIIHCPYCGVYLDDLAITFEE